MAYTAENFHGKNIQIQKNGFSPDKKIVFYSLILTSKKVIKQINKQLQRSPKSAL